MSGRLKNLVQDKLREGLGLGAVCLLSVHKEAGESPSPDSSPRLVPFSRSEREDGIGAQNDSPFWAGALV